MIIKSLDQYLHEEHFLPRNSDEVISEINESLPQLLQRLDLVDEEYYEGFVPEGEYYDEYSAPVNGTTAYDLFKSRFYQGVHWAMEKISHVIQTGMKIVDIGCGDGLMSCYLAHLTGKEGSVLGLDISRGMLSAADKRAKRQNLKNVYFIKGDMDRMPIKDNYAEVVLSANSLTERRPTHYKEPDMMKTIKELRRITSKNGKLILVHHTKEADSDGEINRLIDTISLSGFQDFITSRSAYKNRDNHEYTLTIVSASPK